MKSSMNKGVSKRKTSPRNPSWTTDELILALDLYLKNPLFPPSKNSKDIVELSGLLNKLGKKLSNIKTHTYRNPNGIYMKLMNFRRFDPEYTSNGKVGLQRGGKQDEVIWNKFAKNPNRCHQVAQAIRVSIESHKLTPEEYKDFNDEEAIEGKALTAMHFKRERSRKLVEQRKKQFIRKYGRLFCEACNFDFEERYGKRGEGFIECHHTKPLHTLKPNTKTKTSDLALLCSNCHRMVHAKKDWLTLEELKKLIKA